MEKFSQLEEIKNLKTRLSTNDRIIQELIINQNESQKRSLNEKSIIKKEMEKLNGLLKNLSNFI
jgi:hypothetical protein